MGLTGRRGRPAAQISWTAASPSRTSSTSSSGCARSGLCVTCPTPAAAAIASARWDEVADGAGVVSGVRSGSSRARCRSPPSSPPGTGPVQARAAGATCSVRPPGRGGRCGPPARPARPAGRCGGRARRRSGRAVRARWPPWRTRSAPRAARCRRGGPRGRVTRTQARCWGESMAPRIVRRQLGDDLPPGLVEVEQLVRHPGTPIRRPPCALAVVRARPPGRALSTVLSTTVHDAAPAAIATPGGPRGCTACRGPPCPRPATVTAIGKPDHVERATGPAGPGRVMGPNRRPRPRPRRVAAGSETLTRRRAGPQAPRSIGRGGPALRAATQTPIIMAGPPGGARRGGSPEAVQATLAGTRSGVCRGPRSSSLGSSACARPTRAPPLIRGELTQEFSVVAKGKRTFQPNNRRRSKTHGLPAADEHARRARRAGATAAARAAPRSAPDGPRPSPPSAAPCCRARHRVRRPDDFRRVHASRPQGRPAAAVASMSSPVTTAGLAGRVRRRARRRRIGGTPPR